MLAIFLRRIYSRIYMHICTKIKTSDGVMYMPCNPVKYTRVSHPGTLYESISGRNIYRDRSDRKEHQNNYDIRCLYLNRIVMLLILQEKTINNEYINRLD